MAAQASSSKRILVVDDDPAVGYLIADVLTSEGFEPVLVHDGREAVHTARELTPDAIMLDLELPGLDGHSILQRLRNDARTRRVPVVVGSAASETLSSQERQLVTCALTKPFQLPELVQVVSSIVGRA